MAHGAQGIHCLTDWVNVLRPTWQNRSFRRRSSQGISWLNTEKQKPRQQEQIRIHNKTLQPKINTKKLKPGLVNAYDLQPGNRMGLFW